MAENIGDAFVRMHAVDGGVSDDVHDMFDDIDLHDSGKDAGHDWSDGAEEGIKDRAPEQDVLARFKRMGERLSDLALEGRKVQFAQETGLLLRHIKEEAALKDADDRADAVRGRRSVFRRVRDFADRFRNYEREHRFLDRAVKDVGRFADITGKGLGRGSRNDFLNIIGASARGLIKSLEVIPRLLAPVMDGFTFLFKGFSDGFAEGGKGFSGFIKGIGGMGSAAASMSAVAIPAIAAFVAAATVAVAGLGALVSIASGLLAGITAVAASVSFAVIGALAPLVGLIAPLALAIGPAILAFTALKARSKELGAAFKPLKADFKDLQDAVADPIFDNLSGQVARLSPALQRLRPFAAGVGQAFSDMFGQLTNALSSGGFAQFIDTMSTFVPQVLRSLNRSILSTFGGLGGIFTALIPVTQEFLGWLEDITSRFSAFTNSARGQRALSDFFDSAVRSARSLGGLLRETAGLIGDLFSAGRGTGDTIIDDLTNKVRDFRNFLAANPNGLKDWFANGLDTMRSAGNTILGIAKALASLDTPANRQLGHDIFDALRFGIESVGVAFKVARPFVSAFVFAIDSIRAVLGLGMHAIGLFLDGLGLMADAASHLPFIGDKFKGIADGLHGAADNVHGFADSIIGLPDPEVDAGPATEEIRGLGEAVGGLTSPQLQPDVHVDPALSEVDRLALGLGAVTSPVIEPFFDAGNAVNGMGSLQVAADGFTSPVIEPQADVGEAQHDLGRLRNDIGDFGVTRHKPAILKIITEGLPKVKADIGAARNAIAGPGGGKPVKINIQAQTANVHKQLKTIHDDLNNTAKPRNINVNAKTGAALQAVTGLRKGIEKVKPKDVNLGARTGAALQAVTGLRKGIEKVKDKNTRIDTQTNQAKKNADTLRDAIGNVKDKRTTMTNNTAQAKKNADQLRDAIGNVKNKAVTITANTGAARGAVAALAAGINGLHDRTVTVTTLRNETIRTKREQVPLPGSGGNVGLVPEGRTGPTGVSSGKTVNIDTLTLVSNSPHPRTVANEFLNSLVAASL